jgi:hypothetical protein
VELYNRAAVWMNVDPSSLSIEIIEDLSSTMYSNEMKLEMFCGKTLRGYMMEKKYIFKKVNYKNGAVEISIGNYQTIG